VFVAIGGVVLAHVFHFINVRQRGFLFLRSFELISGATTKGGAGVQRKVWSPADCHCVA
jgi:hypothetical protein